MSWARRPRGRKYRKLPISSHGSNVSVLMSPSELLKRHTKLMAYMATIVQVSQDYAGLAWVPYDAAFCRQAAPTTFGGQLSTPICI